MKRILIPFAALALTMSSYAQEITQCHTPAIEKFAMFASIKDFNNEHLTPLEYTHVSEEGGEMIKFKTADGNEANGFFIPSKNKSNNWIFVFQEWWGLNDNIKRQTEMLYKDLGNVNVLALDMYDGKVTADRSEAGKFMQEFKMERGMAIINGALVYAGPNAKVGTVGWCFGGGLSLQASLLAGKQAVACVIYYGMPEDNVEKLKTLNCDVLDVFAAKDKRINQEVITKFEANMKAAGKNLTVKKYDADHGFANPSNPIFDKASTDDAYKNTIEFFKAKIK